MLYKGVVLPSGIKSNVVNIVLIILNQYFLTRFLEKKLI